MPTCPVDICNDSRCEGEQSDDIKQEINKLLAGSILHPLWCMGSVACLC